MRRNWWVALLALVVVSSSVAAGAFYWDRAQQAAVLGCGSDQVVEQVASAFDQSEIARFARIRALALDSPQQTQLDRFPYKRHCVARVVASDRTRRPVRYSIWNLPDDKFSVALSVLPMDDQPAPSSP
jgi:hypothetical protein